MSNTLLRVGLRGESLRNQMQTYNFNNSRRPMSGTDKQEPFPTATTPTPRPGPSTRPLTAGSTSTGRAGIPTTSACIRAGAALQQGFGVPFHYVVGNAFRLGAFDSGGATLPRWSIEPVQARHGAHRLLRAQPPHELRATSLSQALGEVELDRDLPFGKGKWIGHNAGEC